jgi:hypothetical protein
MEQRKTREGETIMGQNDGVRLQLSQVEVKPSSGRETPDTSFASTLQNGMMTSARVVGNTASAAGYQMIPGAAVLGAAITSAGAVRGAQGANGMVNGGGMTGMGAYGGGMGMGGSGVVNSMGSMNMAASVNSGMGGMGGSMASTGTGMGGYMDVVSNKAAAGDPASQMMMATQQMQEMNQAFNLQYLQLQEKMQQESREFTCLSNVMKAKNDTAKNSLSNLK